jgi:DNA-binding LacI/PurR family transcriptional regulator
MQKEAGYRAAHTEPDVAFRPEYIAYCEKSCESAEQVMTGLLLKHPEIDGVVAAEDLLAVGAGKAIAKLGRSMPLIGFDNSCTPVRKSRRHQRGQRH